MSSAEAPSAAVRTMMPPPFGSSPFTISLSRVRSCVLEPARDARALAVRDVDEEAAGQRDLGRQPCALRLHRILDRLDEDGLAALDQVLDLPRALPPLELGPDDLVHVQEAVLLEPDLDERRLHAGEHVVDDAEVDVPGDRAPLGTLEVDLGDAVVLEDRDALLADVDGDEQLALRRGQRRALRRRPTPAARGRSLALALGLPFGLRSGFALAGASDRSRSAPRRPRRPSPPAALRRAGLLPAAPAATSAAAPLLRGLRRLLRPPAPPLPGPQAVPATSCG